MQISLWQTDAQLLADCIVLHAACNMWRRSSACAKQCNAKEVNELEKAAI